MQINRLPDSEAEKHFLRCMLDKDNDANAEPVGLSTETCVSKTLTNKYDSTIWHQI